MFDVTNFPQQYLPINVYPNKSLPTFIRSNELYLSVMVINEAEKAAYQRQGIHLIFYNQLMQNQCRNELFIILQEVMYKFFAREYVNNINNNTGKPVETICLFSAQWANSFVISNFLANNQNLQREATQEQLGLANQTLGEYNILEQNYPQVYTILENMTNQQRPVQTNVMNNAGVGYLNNNVNNYTSNSNSNITDRYASNSNSNITNRYASTTTNTNSNTQGNIVDRYSSVSQPSQQFQQANTQQFQPLQPLQQVAQPQQEIKPEVFSNTFKQEVRKETVPSNIKKDEIITTLCDGKDWKPTSNRPFRILVSKRTHDKFHRRDVLVGVSDVIFEVVRCLTGDEMNKTEHMVGRSSTGYRYETHVRNDQLAKAVITLNAATEDKIQNPNNCEVSKKKLQSLESPNTLLADDLNVAIREVRKSKLMCQNNERLVDTVQLFKSDCVLKNEYICSKTFNDIVNEISSCVDFKQVAEILKTKAALIERSYNLNGEVLSQENIDLDIFLNDLNVRFTKMVNNFLEIELGQTNIEIRDFKVDALDLGKDLSEKYPNYGDEFRKFEHRIMKCIFDYDEFLGNEEYTLNSTFVPEGVTVMLIDVLSDELAFDFTKERTYCIQSGTIPWLFELSKGLYRAQSVSDFNSTTNYLVTLDNKIYTITKGVIGIESYMLTIIRE